MGTAVTPLCGDTYGLHLPLLAGTEVSIAFEDGNPTGHIAGVKHDSAHTDHVTIQNYKRNVLRTPANNKIRWTMSGVRSTSRLAQSGGRAS